MLHWLFWQLYQLYLSGRDKPKDLAKWLREKRKLVIFHELLFLAAFLLWAVVRGANPEISGTEKPMELAFINAIYQSPDFPPNDPWLSGYSISYYYFGYILVAGIMKLIGTVSGTAFNLAVALVFGLAASTSSGILYNLLLMREIHLGISISPKRLRRVLLLSLLAPLFILVCQQCRRLIGSTAFKGDILEYDCG